MPTRYSRAGRLSSMPLMVCIQEKLVSYPSGATAILSRSSFAFGGGAVCAQTTVTTNPIAPTTPQSVLRCQPLCIVLSLRCQPDVLQVGEVARDHPRKRILLRNLPHSPEFSGGSLDLRWSKQLTPSRPVAP